MEEAIPTAREDNSVHLLTLRDFLAIGFRHRRLIALSFWGTFFGVVLTALLLPSRYEARLRILVKHARLDPVVTPEPNSTPQLAHDLVSEEEMNSEVELLKSRDLLEKVAIACDLHLGNGMTWLSRFSSKAADRNERIARAVRKLEAELKVELLSKTNLIEVTYRSPDPKLSARVLTTLADRYLEKHLAVHRPPGAFDFFRREADRYREGLAEAESRLSSFSRDQEVVSAQLERDSTLQNADAFDAALRQTGATIAETDQRIRTLKRLAAAAVPRRTTQARTSDNPQLLERLKSTLLNLELKRTEWMDKYDPSYRPVRELETEIAQTRATLAAEEKLPLRDETTDRDPTFDWVNEELAKATTDLASLRARAAATAEIARAYQDKAHRLGQDGIVEQDLIREVKTQEGNYTLYLQKQEEARISDALDSRGILNATIAETAAVPTLPSSPPWPLLFLVGSLTATVVGLGAAFTSEYLDPFLRTPREAEEFLGVPVLAAIPDNSAALSQNRQHPSNPYAWIAPSEVSHRNSG